MSNSTDRSFRGKVKYDSNGKVIIEESKESTVQPIVQPIQDSVKAFINEPTDNSGIPIISANGIIDRFNIDTPTPTHINPIHTTDEITATSPIVQPIVQSSTIDLPITTIEDWNAMVSRGGSKSTSTSMSKVNTANTVTNTTASTMAAFLQALYDSEPDGRATDEVGFSPKGDLVTDGWIEMPSDYPARFIQSVQTMSVMTTDVPIEFLTESDIDKLVTKKGHMLFPIVLHVFTPAHYKGGRLLEYLNNQLTDEFATVLDEEMVRGDGMARPIGLFPRVSMLNESGTLDQQGIAPPGVRSIRLVGVAPNQEAILDIGMFFALDMELLSANNEQPLPNAKWYMNSSVGLHLAEMKGVDGEYILDHDSPAMQMVGVPESLAGHDIVYNELMDDLFAGGTPIILGDLTGVYELKVSPRFYIKRLADSQPTMADEVKRQYAIGFYMVAGINLAPPDQVDENGNAPTMPYVGIVIDGLVSMSNQNDSENNSTVDKEEKLSNTDKEDESTGTNVEVEVDVDVEVKPDIVVTQTSNRLSHDDVSSNPALQPTKPTDKTDTE